MRKCERKHVLAVLREMLGIGQKDSASVLGIPEDMVSKLERGAYREGKLNPRQAWIVSGKTGISPAWLLKGDGRKPPIATFGGPYTREAYLRHQDQQEMTADDLMQLFQRLAGQLGAVLLAAYACGQARSATWNIRTELNKIGLAFPDFGVPSDDPRVPMPRARNFTIAIQKCMDEVKQYNDKTAQKTPAHWNGILIAFDRELTQLEKKNPRKRR
jgi:transcriptional regulator with XRE-family HTH domain